MNRAVVLGGAVVGATTATLLMNNNRTQKPFETTVGAYLSPQALDDLKAQLPSRLGLGNIDTKLVVLKRAANSEEDFIYSALYGQTAAFRLKGVIKSIGKDGKDSVAAFGTLSTIGGPLSADDYIVSMPILMEGQEDSFDLDATSDLPTRLKRSLQAKHIDMMQNKKNNENMNKKETWEGKITLSSTSIMGRAYGPTDVEVIALDKDKAEQLVLGLTLCSSAYAQRDGTCQFRPKINTVSSSAPSSSSISDSKEVEESKPKLKDRSEDCPICTYVKAGSCHNEFIELQKYHDAHGQPGFDHEAYSRVGVAMFECMSKDEYYDAFVVDLRNQQMVEDNKIKEKEKQKQKQKQKQMNNKQNKVV
jgi:hypothetical protein